MRVTHVSLRPTEAATVAGRPALTPELLAATGARYSRSNEGLEAILARVDPGNLDRSVDGIFRMLDYGHQSIADMVPVALFIDGVSGWLAYTIWSLCPTAGGQESSTRYLELSRRHLPDPGLLGIPAGLRPEWSAAMELAFDRYAALRGCWEALLDARPELLRLPRSLRDDPSEKARRQIARMRRNFAFDRSRYLLPAAALTNLMLVMSARGWASLCQHLCSHPLPEAQAAGASIRAELALCAPRLLRHADATASIRAGLAAEFAEWQQMAAGACPACLAASDSGSDHPSDASLRVLMPPDLRPGQLAAALAHHDNRYAWIGSPLRRMAVSVRWEAMAFGEIRDLNRHRTGSKQCPQVPLGFYAAQDEVPTEAGELGSELADAAAAGREISRRGRDLLAAGEPASAYWTLLGTQFSFEHVTTADKFIYEAELRTGTGAHFRYARHLHDALTLWYARFPETKGRVLEGTAEPE